MQVWVFVLISTQFVYIMFGSVTFRSFRTFSIQIDMAFTQNNWIIK